MIAYDYFQSYKNYFWQWEENADVLAIPQENTIAYRELIAETLERLSHQGVPPFGTLLLTIIATNPNGRNSIDVVYAILSNSIKTSDDPSLANAIEFLKLLSEVPPEFKQGKKRILLLQTIFENCHHIYSVKKSKTISESFISRKLDTTQLLLKKDFNINHFQREIKPLYVLKNKFGDVNEILEKVIALPEYDEPLPDLDTPSENSETKDLAEQLIANPKTFHVGSLIKRIWSGLNIPLHSTLPSMQPLGGVADLTNKGDFDKLLISEYANDDIVFLSRLANSEALYIHREIPPANNSLERIILMDVSLKNWGTPKAVSFATMLAIATHPKTDIACSAFTIGNSFHPVSTISVEAIIEGLQFLEGSLHAANGLEAFFKEHPAGKNREIFFITEPSTLKQPAMAKAMSDYQPFISYWIFTDRSGNIDIYKKQQSSKKHIQHLQLPLEKLWEKEPKNQITNKQKEGPFTNYPILFRNSQNVKAMMTTPDGQNFIVTGDKVLLRLFDIKAKLHTKGWEMLIEKIPGSVSEFEIGLSSKGEYILLMFDPHARELTLMNLISGEKKLFNLQNWKSVSTHGFVFQNQKFYHLNNKGHWAIDFEGVVSVDPSEDGIPGKAVFENRAEELKKAAAGLRASQSAFRNVKDIFINENDHLVFNIHELLVNSGSHLKLDVTAKIEKKLIANKIREGEFIFPDGSRIEIHKAGLFILKSSSDVIPVIYLPSLLDSSLAIATETTFAGNDFFYPEPQYDVILTNAGEKRLAVVKSGKELSGMGLKHVHDQFQNTPCRIMNNQSITEAEKIKRTLEADGATIEVHLSRPSMQEIERISVPFFYQKYITPFIKHILDHGTQN